MTDFAKKVKKRMIDLDMSGGELIERVREKTGLYCDGGYIARIFRGERNAPKIVTAIKEILELEEDV